MLLFGSSRSLFCRGDMCDMGVMHLQGPQVFVVRSGTGQAYLRNPPSDNQPAILHKDIKLRAGSESLHSFVLP